MIFAGSDRDGAVITRLHGHRVALLVGFDVVTWCLALMVFTVLRYDMAGTTASAADWAAMCLITAAVHVVLASIVRLHQGRALVGSFEEVLLLSGVTLTTGVIASLINAFGPVQWLPRTVPVAATFLALIVQGWGRAVWRRLRERDEEQVDRSEGRRTLIMGVGDAGRQLLHSMLRDPGGRYVPVGFLDDDPLKRHRRMRGLPVLGTSHDIAIAAETTGATLLVLAMPRAGPDVVRRVGSAARDAGLEVKILPGIGELYDGRVGIQDIRDIDVADLLGRHQIEIDVASIAGYLTGKRVLVTGAGGSIGSELCRQIHQFGPAELIMLDRDESALHAVQLAITGRALLDSSDVVLGDIREPRFLMELFVAAGVRRSSSTRQP